MRTTHPDELDLETVRSGEAPPEIVAHVAGCAECTAHLRELEAVTAILKGLHETDAPPVRDTTDRQIRWIARKEARRVRRARPIAVALRYTMAVAAVAVLAVGTIGLLGRSEPSAPTRLARGDVNTDGTVDILDAYAVAMKQSRHDRSSADVDGSGMVDEADAAQIARWAVSLSKS